MGLSGVGSLPGIPEFPNFTRVGIEHREAFAIARGNLPAYSDSSVWSIVSWDLEDLAVCSALNGSVVIRLPDYETGELITTILGESVRGNELDLLIDRFGRLDLVPEEIAAHYRRPDRQVEFDRDHDDYVLDCTSLVAAEGSQYTYFRNQIARLERSTPSIAIRALDLRVQEDRREILEVADRWAEKTHQDANEIGRELGALRRLLKKCAEGEADGLLALCLVDGRDAMLAFEISERVQSEWFVCGFLKTVDKRKGLSRKTLASVADRACRVGVRYLNLEQDLGLDGLRDFKSSLRPVRMLRKARISRG